MIELKHKIISSLPVLELVSKDVADEKLATIFFYHGWESYKERVLEQGYSLAKQGFRVVLPEALDHGERRENSQATQNPLNFWGVVTSNIKEFPVLVDHYIHNNKTIPDRIGVAGLSMGGITTSAILTQYDWVKSAVILMGSPSPIEFTTWLLRNYKIDKIPVYELLDQQLIETRLNELTPISLNLQPEKIANRPVHFWHGTADPVVPAYLTKAFIEENSGKTYSQNVTFEFSEGIEHKVPREIIAHMTEYFFKHL